MNLAPGSDRSSSGGDLRLEMLQVARLAPQLLGESAGLVRAFLCSQQNADGGFKDRAGSSDLYYTAFGVDGLIALRATPDVASLAGYLDGFGDGAGLDFVHLCCLARVSSALERLGEEVSLAGQAGGAPAAPARRLDPGRRLAILERIEAFRSADGGYAVNPGAAEGTAYGCFLAVGARQDLRAAVAEPQLLARSLKFLEREPGSWANERGVPEGSTNATAAAVTVLRALGFPVAAVAGDWLLARSHPHGGFAASARAPMPDLLSTATALHALAGLQREIASVREKCLDFVDSLWTNDGGFFGHWADDHLDCEYTYYGLLALGHLSVGG